MPSYAYPSPEWPDRELVAACTSGDSAAWHALIEKYKRLVYSAPARYKMNADDSADVFQFVWMIVFRDMHLLRDADSLKGWIMQIAMNRCFKLAQKRRAEESIEERSDIFADPAPLMPDAMDRAERYDRLRRCIAKLPPRCQALIRDLFFTDPPPPYAEVAAKHGLAVGSIGFIRGRCLKKLRAAVEGTR